MMHKLILSLLVLAPLASTASVYKWVDDEGNVHYGDKPTGSAQEEIRIRDETVDTRVSGTREERREKLLEAMEEDRIEAEEQRKKDQAARAKKRKRCLYLKDRMRSMKKATRVYRLDKDGNRVYMDDKKRTASEKRLRAKIRKACS